MAIQDELLDIEKTLWAGGVADYRRALDSDCLVAFDRMAGVSSRDQIAATVEDSHRWHDLEIKVDGLLQPTDDVAILTYHASAVRDEQPYEALVSSGYVRRDGGWKMMFHQQTPLTN